MNGTEFSADTREFLRLLDKFSVRYLIVGGQAVIHHGYPRLTGDVDFFFDRDAGNSNRLFAALEEFWGGDIPSIASVEDLTHDDLVIQFGRPPNRIDLLSSLGSVDFASAWSRRIIERMVSDETELPVFIISLPDLIQSKKDAGRHKDLDDIEHLLSSDSE